jgi:hypothetical protein
MRKRRPPFVSPCNGGETWYDLIEDYELIEASFAQQYGIRLRKEEDMPWGEFTTLLGGLNGETPLGHIVSIRSEKDSEKIKKFSPQERKIRNEWRTKHRRIITDTAEYDFAMSGFRDMFKSLSEKGG